MIALETLDIDHCHEISSDAEAALRARGLRVVGGVGPRRQCLSCTPRGSNLVNRGRRLRDRSAIGS